MKLIRQVILMSTVIMSVWLAVSTPTLAGGDFDEDGYVSLNDYFVFNFCFTTSGPGSEPAFQACTDTFDEDADQDVDLADFAAFARQRGHLPIPLRDTFGDVIRSGSTEPYSGRQTCTGACHAHDIDHISNGFKFQHGRTDVDGNIIMQEDFFEDGRYWHRSPSRYGLWGQPAGWRIFSAKDNANESALDNTTFEWVSACGACHSGGGPGEFDRDGVRLFEPATGQFGYELLGKSAIDVAFDGDYAYMSPMGQLNPAPWDATGVSEPDCLNCHTPDPGWNNGQNVNRYIWRMSVLAARDRLVDDQGSPVQAYAAVGAAGQGWFSNIDIAFPQLLATRLQLDYSVGVAAGTLELAADDAVALSPKALTVPPRDNACWMCHAPSWTVLRGALWFDERDIHYRKLTRRNDDDASNDIPAANAKACAFCHPGNLEHNLAKGSSFSSAWRDELDWVGFRSCRECHLTEIPPGVPNVNRHPDAPDVPGDVIVHQAGGMMEALSCQACHVPYALLDAQQRLTFFDITVGGVPGYYWAAEYYSADPLDPASPDKSRWYPAFFPKRDSDGEVRLFPAALFLSLYWGDWDQNGTPDLYEDDVIAPIPIWKINQVTGWGPLPGTTDDNGDGKIEVNRPEEILAYIQALKGNDQYGRRVASNPVLVKGWRVWYEDSNAPEGVNWLDSDECGINTNWKGGVWGFDHNVLAQEKAWGAFVVSPAEGCNHCHRPGSFDSPVFDRLILVDPFDENGVPVYRKVREMTGLNPP